MFGSAWRFDWGMGEGRCRWISGELGGTVNVRPNTESAAVRLWNYMDKEGSLDSMGRKLVNYKVLYIKSTRVSRMKVGVFRKMMMDS
jgi:hypothetical protein